MDTNDPRAGYEPGFAPWRVSETDYDFMMSSLDEEPREIPELKQAFEKYKQAIADGRLQVE